MVAEVVVLRVTAGVELKVMAGVLVLRVLPRLITDGVVVAGKPDDIAVLARVRGIVVGLVVPSVAVLDTMLVVFAATQRQVTQPAKAEVLVVDVIPSPLDP